MSPLRDTSERPADVWLFRLFAGAVAFAAVAAGGRYGGRYLHEQEAWTKANSDRAPGLEGRREVGLELSKGWRDTKVYEEFRMDLTTAEQSAATVVPHPLEKHGPLAAGIAAALAIMGSYAPAKVWAAKRAAQRSLRR